jgi:hypothetical protein
VPQGNNPRVNHASLLAIGKDRFTPLLARSCASVFDVTPGLLVDNSWDRILINLSCLFHSWAHSWACMMDLYPKDLSRWGIEGTVRSDLALAAFNSEIALSL